MTNEEFQKVVLEELRRIHARIGRLEEGQEKMNARTGKLEEGQKEMNARIGKLEEGQAAMNARIGKLEEGQKEMNTRIGSLEEGQEEIRKGLMAVIEQTADLTEFRQEINEKVDKVIEELNTLEIVTSKNWHDIAKLKAAK